MLTGTTDGHLVKVDIELSWDGMLLRGAFHSLKEVLLRGLKFSGSFWDVVMIVSSFINFKDAKPKVFQMYTVES